MKRVTFAMDTLAEALQFRAHCRILCLEAEAHENFLGHRYTATVEGKPEVIQAAEDSFRFVPA